MTKPKDEVLIRWQSTGAVYYAASGCLEAVATAATPKQCPDCHHSPSRRIADHGAECQCKCHDVADAAPELLAALVGLFEHCAMVHKHWGDGCNREQADRAIDGARALLAKLTV
jgi:hypothetical protein